MSEYNLYGKFAPDQPVGLAIKKWWEALSGSPGDRAGLRRAKNCTEVAMQPAYYWLLNHLLSLKEKEKFYFREENLACLAGLLSHVKHFEAGSFAARMNTPRSSPPVSDLRFRRILRVENLDDLYIMMIRFIRMMDAKANIYDLARSILYWNDRTKKEWASQYYFSEDWDFDQENNETKQKQGA